MAGLNFLARRGVMPLLDAENRNPDEVADYLATEQKVVQEEIKRNSQRGYS